MLKSETEIKKIKLLCSSLQSSKCKGQKSKNMPLNLKKKRFQLKNENDNWDMF